MKNKILLSTLLICGGTKVASSSEMTTSSLVSTLEDRIEITGTLIDPTDQDDFWSVANRVLSDAPLEDEDVERLKLYFEKARERLIVADSMLMK